MDALILIPLLLAMTAGVLLTGAGWVARCALSGSLVPAFSEGGRQGLLAGLICEVAVIAGGCLMWPLELLPVAYRREKAAEGLNPVVIVGPPGLGRPLAWPLLLWCRAKKIGPVSCYVPSRRLRAREGSIRPASGLGRHINRVARDTGAQKVDVVAFGGSGSRLMALLLNPTEDSTMPPVGQLIALASPLRGAGSALFLPWTRDLLGPVLGQDQQLPPGVEVVWVQAEVDPFLTEDECAAIPGVERHVLPLAGHLSLLVSRAVYEHLQAILRARHAGPMLAVRRESEA